jgi:hypothetical protein
MANGYGIILLKFIIMSRVWVTYRLGLDWMIPFIAPYTFTRQYSAIVILHNLSSPLHTH